MKILGFRIVCLFRFWVDFMNPKFSCYFPFLLYTPTYKNETRSAIQRQNGDLIYQPQPFLLRARPRSATEGHSSSSSEETLPRPAGSPGSPFVSSSQESIAWDCTQAPPQVWAMSSVMSASPGVQLCPCLGGMLIVREGGSLPGKALLCSLGAPSQRVACVWFMA